jgi:predicted phosphoribosyltransferase
MFADACDAGKYVAKAIVTQAVDLQLTMPTVVGISPSSLPIVQRIAGEFAGSRSAIVEIDSESGEVTGDLPLIEQGNVIVTSLGVETGRAALNVFAWLKTTDHRCVVLAVPVCPRQVETHLARRYDRVIAIERPFGRRSLRWHYAVPLE